MARPMSDASDGYVRMTPYRICGTIPNKPYWPIERTDTEFHSSDFQNPTGPLPTSAGPTALSEFAPTLPQHEIGFTTLVQRFSSILPQRVQVTRAVYTYGENEDALLAQDDVYDIHFIHHRKTATLLSSTGTHYQVPINSTLMFGLMYEHDQTSTTEVVFPSISDIIEAKIKPKVVCVKKTYLGSTPEKTVCAGEILAIISTEAVTSENGCSLLKVYSFACKSDKLLPFFCSGSFTTVPSDVQLSLLEIVAYVRNPFPSKVMLFAGTNRPYSSEFSQSFLGQVYEMVDLCEVATIVASPQLSDVCTSEIEIPIDVEVKITLIKLSDEDMAVLKTNTQMVLRRYDESLIEHLWQTSNFDCNRHQSQLLKHVRPIREADYSSSYTCVESSDEEEWISNQHRGIDTRLAGRAYCGDVVKDVGMLKETCEQFRKQLKSIRFVNRTL